MIKPQQLRAALHVHHLPEPLLPEDVNHPMRLYIHGELVSEWHELI